jgi:hypothetical protein
MEIRSSGSKIEQRLLQWQVPPPGKRLSRDPIRRRTGDIGTIDPPEAAPAVPADRTAGTGVCRSSLTHSSVALAVDAESDYSRRFSSKSLPALVRRT